MGALEIVKVGSLAAVRVKISCRHPITPSCKSLSLSQCDVVFTSVQDRLFWCSQLHLNLSQAHVVLLISPHKWVSLHCSVSQKLWGSLL